MSFRSWVLYVILGVSLDWRPAASDHDVSPVVVHESLRHEETKQNFEDYNHQRLSAGEERDIGACSCQVSGIFSPGSEAGEDWYAVEDDCEEEEDDEREETRSILHPYPSQGDTAGQQANQTKHWELHFFYQFAAVWRLEQKDIN